MPRKKNYETSRDLAKSDATAKEAPARPIVSVADAFIDMAALLGPEARFPGRRRHLDLRTWLDRGIDDWVCTSGFCLRAMLLSGTRSTASVTTYYAHLPHLFEYLAGNATTPAAPRVKTPEALSPLHIKLFIGWLEARSQANAWRKSTVRSIYKAVKAVLQEMFAQGFIAGERSRYFQRSAVDWRNEDSLQTSLSDVEQERLARALKSDLVAVHHGNLCLTQGAVQGLRLLLVAHRQGLNPTPLIEMRRDALAPGFLPGTIRMRTSKHRNKKVLSSIGRASQTAHEHKRPDQQNGEQDLFFDLSEGAVLQQAIASTRDLVNEAPAALKQRIWLYRAEASSGATTKGSVTCLDAEGLKRTIDGVVRRHSLLGDNGKPLRLNLSRLRKSRFDRALRAADGDMAITANLMGNTPRVAGAHYPSMNDARKAEAAGFMNDDYTALMRAQARPPHEPEIRPVQIHPYKVKQGETSSLPTPTPVSGCKDSVHGEHAPGDGLSHCDRFVMCLFCSSFAIVGTVDELWRLFSFQEFARAELDHLDQTLGHERTADEVLEELRDRYRIAIPYIDDFTQRQFARNRVAKARSKTAIGLHPFWLHQMTMSRRARSGAPVQTPREDNSQAETGRGESFGT